MLYGRSAECGAVLELLDAARVLRSSALVVRGDAGVGKSALVGFAADRSDGVSVLRCAGVESEAELPFAALHQLVRPVLLRRVFIKLGISPRAELIRLRDLDVPVRVSP